MTNYNKTLIEIGIKIVKQFEDDNQKVMDFFISLPSLRKLMVSVYYSLVSEKLLLPIQSNTNSEKLKIWQEAKDISNGKLNNDDCIELSKVLYVLKKL
jgi:hypothetical protein